MIKWDAFLWDRISLDDDATWAVDRFSEQGKQIDELGNRLNDTHRRIAELCR